MSKSTTVIITLTLAAWLFTVVAVAVTGVRPYDPTSRAGERTYRVALADE